MDNTMLKNMLSNAKILEPVVIEIKGDQITVKDTNKQESNNKIPCCS